ncbi:MAG TPA: hypothetical protein VED17_03990 [Nitrososphaerales archaeon]|nr:hypothetical protein [Nitrososphaerales archaeon]
MRASGFNTPPTKRQELSRKSMVILFTVGAIMLAAPLGTVLSESAICKSDASSCIHSEDYGYLVSAFPYIMLGGGVLIGFNMKRISDAINAPVEDESDEGADDGTLSYP